MKKNKLMSLLQRFAGFTLCNIPGTLVELVVVWICSTYVFHNYFGQYVASPIIAFECAVFTNFTFYHHIVWHDRMNGIGLRGHLVKLGEYNLSATMIYILRMVIIQVMGIVWKTPVVWCEVVSLSFSGLFNFVINDRLIFACKGRRKNNLPVAKKVVYLHLKTEDKLWTPSSS